MTEDLNNNSSDFAKVYEVTSWEAWAAKNRTDSFNMLASLRIQVSILEASLQTQYAIEKNEVYDD